MRTCVPAHRSPTRDSASKPAPAKVRLMPSALNGRGYFSAKRQSVVNTEPCAPTCSAHGTSTAQSYRSHTAFCCAYLRYYFRLLSYLQPRLLRTLTHHSGFLNKLSKLPSTTITTPTDEKRTLFSDRIYETSQSLHPPAGRAIGRRPCRLYNNFCMR